MKEQDEAVKSIEGFASVTNNIEVLPVCNYGRPVGSGGAIYQDAVVFRYGESAVPVIYITVKKRQCPARGRRGHRVRQESRES